MANTMRRLALLPVMLSFFVMGAVDLVGIASNYLKEDLSLTNFEASLFPMLVFFWFLVCAVPAAALMNRLGRKATLMLALALTAVALLIPCLFEGYAAMLVSFALLGIGNAVMQTALNPLLSFLVRSNKLAASISFGQFVKAIASFAAPYIAAWGALIVVNQQPLGWKLVYPAYLAMTLLTGIVLFLTHLEGIDQAKTDATGFKNAWRLFLHPTIMLCFFAIVCHVGIDVGINSTAPKLFVERVGDSFGAAAYATSVYFLARTVGCLLGAMLLCRLPPMRFLLGSVLIMMLGVALLFVTTDDDILMLGILLLGLGNSNVFPIIFAKAMQTVPENRNEVSGLMITGLFGGALFPVVMGYAADLVGQWGAVAVMAVATLYLLVITTLIREEQYRA